MTPIVGRVVERGLSDEANDRHYLIVDATDGRSHYVDIGRGDATGVIPENAIVRIRSEEHTSELQSLMRISYAVFCLKKKKSHNHEKHLTSRHHIDITITAIHNLLLETK